MPASIGPLARLRREATRIKEDLFAIGDVDEAFAQIDEAAQSRFLEMRPCDARLLGLVFGANHHAIATCSMDIVTHGRAEIQRRNSVGRAGLDNATGIVGAA
jgi:hypothetical protein